MDKLYIVIPAYNEEANIKNVIDEWYQIIKQYHGENQSRLVLIDDGSVDKTYEVMKDCMKEKPLLEVITKENTGHGATVLYGYRYALKREADYVFQTDSDGQTLANEFETFWKNRREYDALIGNRTSRMDRRGGAEFLLQKHYN